MLTKGNILLVSLVITCIDNCVNVFLEEDVDVNYHIHDQIQFKKLYR